MSDDLKRLANYLDHILHAIKRIQSYTEDNNEVAFLQNEMAQDAIIRNLEVIGEASHNIEHYCPEFSSAHPELPLAIAYEMRNALAHGYFQIDLGIVWQTIQNDLPPLNDQVETLRFQLGSVPSG